MTKSTLIVIIISFLAITLIMAEVPAQNQSIPSGGMHPGFVEFIQSFGALDRNSKCRLSKAQREKVVTALEQISVTLEKLGKNEENIEKALTKDQLDYIQAQYSTGRLGPVNEPPIFDQINGTTDTVITEAVKSLQKTKIQKTGRPAKRQ